MFKANTPPGPDDLNAAEWLLLRREAGDAVRWYLVWRQRLTLALWLSVFAFLLVTTLIAVDASLIATKARHYVAPAGREDR